MVKFLVIGEKNKSPINMVGMGISEKNVENLKKGMPIILKLSNLLSDKSIPYLGANDEIMLFYGETEEKILSDLKANGVNLKDARSL